MLNKSLGKSVLMTALITGSVIWFAASACRRFQINSRRGEKRRPYTKRLRCVKRRVCRASERYIVSLKGARSGNIPVSYTHLDVYKRQKAQRYGQAFDRRRKGFEKSFNEYGLSLIHILYLVLESLVLENNGRLHALVVPDSEQAESEGIDKSDICARAMTWCAKWAAYASLPAGTALY